MKKIISFALVFVLSCTMLAGCGSKTDSNVLKVGMDLRFPPFTYMDENGKPAGLEVEIANALGEYMGHRVEIINTDFSMLTTALEAGEIDIVIKDMTIKEERKEKTDISTPYMYGRTLSPIK